jgi:ATP/ADP translocase
MALSISRLTEGPSPELLEIVKQEGCHFTKERISKIIFTFFLLFCTIFIFNFDTVTGDSIVDISIKAGAITFFGCYCMLATWLSSK